MNELAIEGFWKVNKSEKLFINLRATTSIFILYNCLKIYFLRLNINERKIHRDAR